MSRAAGPVAVASLVIYTARMNGSDFREYFTDAIRFWEPRRVLYNLALAVIVVAYFLAGYPKSKLVLSIDFALGLFLLAVAANVAYCAAYLADIFVQASGLETHGNARAGCFSESERCSPPSSRALSQWGCSNRAARRFQRRKNRGIPAIGSIRSYLKCNAASCLLRVPVDFAARTFGIPYFGRIS